MASQQQQQQQLPLKQEQQQQQQQQQQACTTTSSLLFGVSPKEAVFTPFVEKKLRSFFKVLDANKNGEIRWSDHEMLASRLTEIAKLDRGRSNQVRRKFLKIYEDLHGEEVKVGPITEDVFIESIKKRGIARFLRIVHEIYLAMFDAIDKDGDGFITKQQFGEIYKVFNYKEAKPGAAFKQFDTNKDGRISMDEFVTAAVDFYTSNDEQSPSKHFFGILQ